MVKKKDLPRGMTKRGNVYWTDFCVGGRRIRESLCGNLRVATDLLDELRARAKRGDFGLLDNNVPVEKLKKQYLRHCRQTLKPSTVQRYEYNLKAILPDMPVRIAQVTIDAVMCYRDSRLADDVSPRTINMDVAALAAMFNWGVTHQMIDSNPVRGIKPLPHDNPKGKAGH